jgi:alpha-D-ribose 1-methylphosphonate 5-triphosphate synthase subunit PhnG
MIDTEHRLDPETLRRQNVMFICAHANLIELEAAVAELEPLAHVTDVRPPQFGLVMVRGRVGAVGNAFNVGEALVTRASVQLQNGMIGHSYLLGRARKKARLAAIIDALSQSPDAMILIQKSLIAPVSERLAREKAAQAEETASTKVDFFTLVRGED